jgi:cytochrome c oxidase assembly factor CtaG/cytochrome c2
MYPLIASLAALLLLTGAGAANAGEAPLARALEWSWEPWVLASIALATVLYAAGFLRLRGRRCARPILRHREAAAFAAGIGTIFVALISPLDGVADQLFWVHMVQHLLLLVVAPPLFVWSRPAIAWLWAFPLSQRKRIGRFWRGGGLGRAVEALMHPLVVWVLFSGFFIFWHFPRPYQWALQDELVHDLEHISFFVSGLMFWSIVIEPSGRRRLGYGATLVFVMTTTTLAALPGALIALAPRVLYPDYVSGAADWGLTELQDQQIAGIVMWVPGGFIYLAAACWVFFNWLRDAGRREALRERKSAAFAAMLVMLLALPSLSACGKSQADETKGLGDAHRGAQLIAHDGCGACHTIPGIANADGVVGPPLTQFGRRIYIAGMLRNTRENLVAWIRTPQRIIPGNAMPDMGLDAADARDIAAYLRKLQ